jgi:hypothetical protein
MGDLDIATLPDELKNSSVIPPQTVTVTWESQINQEDLRPSKVQRLMELSTFYITIATVIAFLIFIVFLFYSKVSIQKSVGDKKYALIPNFSIKHRYIQYEKSITT